MYRLNVVLGNVLILIISSARYNSRTLPRRGVVHEFHEPVWGENPRKRYRRRVCPVAEKELLAISGATDAQVKVNRNVPVTNAVLFVDDIPASTLAAIYASGNRLVPIFYRRPNSSRTVAASKPDPKCRLDRGSIIRSADETYRIARATRRSYRIHFCWDVLPRSPYSSDLVPRDHRLFIKLKEYLGGEGKYRQRREPRTFHDQLSPKGDGGNGIRRRHKKFVPRYRKYLELNGDYVEKWRDIYLLVSCNIFFLR